MFSGFLCIINFPEIKYLIVLHNQMLDVCGHALSPFVAAVLESIFLYYSILQLSNYSSPLSVLRIGKNEVKIVSSAIFLLLM